MFLLGAVLYEILTGQPPYRQTATHTRTLDNALSLHERLRTILVNVQPAEDANPHAPPALAAICRRAMSRDGKFRYRNAGEFETALRRYLRQTQAEAQSCMLGDDLQQLEEQLAGLQRTGQPPSPVIEPLRKIVGQFELAHRSLFANLRDVTGGATAEAHLERRLPATLNPNSPQQPKSPSPRAIGRPATASSRPGADSWKPKPRATILNPRAST